MYYKEEKLMLALLWVTIVFKAVLLSSLQLPGNMNEENTSRYFYHVWCITDST